MEWMEASYRGQSGWIATSYLYEIEGDYERIGKEGCWLFRDMNGAIDMYLWFGTPFQVIQTATDDEGVVWQEIRLPDGSTSWIEFYARLRRHSSCNRCFEATTLLHCSRGFIPIYRRWSSTLCA